MKPVHILLVILIAATWGFNFVVIKVGVHEVPPFLFTGLRFSLAAIPAIFFIERPKEPLSTQIAFGLFLGVGQFGFLFLSIYLGLSASLASLVLQLQACFTMLLAWAILREAPKTAQLIGAAIAFSGIGVIAYQRWSGPEVIPLVLCVLASTGWASANIISKSANIKNPLAFVIWTSLVPPLPMFALSAIFEDHQRISDSLFHPTALGMGATAYLAFLSTLFGYSAWNYLLKRYPAGVVAPFSLLVPLFGIISGVLVLGESFDKYAIIGAALVIAGLLFSNFGARIMHYIK
jgi:O-acetylserine/cysteine efflux transporter